MEAKEPMEAIKEELYDRLKREHGFTEAERIRTPGSCDPLTKDDVEVEAIALPAEMHGKRWAGENARVDIRINVPVNAREDALFTTFSCANEQYLGQRETIALRTREDIDANLGKIVELAKRGAGIIMLSGQPLLEYKKFRYGK